MISFHKFLFGKFNEFRLDPMYPLNNSFLRVFGEWLMVYDVLMEIVPQEIATACPTMSVIHGKEGWFDPIFIYVENNAYSVLIIVPWDSLMSIYGIRFDKAISLSWSFWFLHFGKLLFSQEIGLFFLKKFVIFF